MNIFSISKSHQGFTLIELLVVISIIGVLSSTILVSLNSARDRANTAKILSFSTSLQHALGADLVAAYTFNDGTAKDESGLGNNGTIYGGATFVNSIPELKKALSFDGVDDYVDVGNGASLNITSVITVEAWVKKNYISPTTYKGILGKYRPLGGGTGAYRLGAYGDRVRFDVGGLTAAVISNSNSYNSTDWAHIVGVYTGSELRIYINGALLATQAATGSININTKKLVIGGDGDGSAGSEVGNRFSGLIDEVHIYNSALPLAQIQQDYVKGLSTHIIALE